MISKQIQQTKRNWKRWRIEELSGPKKGPHPINENGKLYLLPTSFVIKPAPRATEKKVIEMIKNFAYNIYWETGARIVVTIGYQNTKDTVYVRQ